MARRVRCKPLLIIVIISMAFTFEFAHLISSVLISAPFDNFRIECPQSSGAQRLSIRMIESQGLKRQDAVYALSCNHIEELYPWPGIPANIREIEREDCRYSPPFDPIIENSVNYTCKNREYLTGIARLSDTRIQVECCRMRTRDEISCSEEEFLKPFGPDSRTEIEFNAKLINAISIEGRKIRVRFCALAPRAFEMIKADVKTTTTARPTTTTTSATTPFETSKTTQPDSNEEFTENLAVILQPKRIIKISQKSSLSQKGNWSTQYPNTTHTDATTISPPNTDNNDNNESENQANGITSDLTALVKNALDRNEVPLRDLSHVQQPQQNQQQKQMSELSETQKIVEKEISTDTKSLDFASNSQQSELKKDENVQNVSFVAPAEENFQTFSTEFSSTTISQYSEKSIEQQLTTTVNDALVANHSDDIATDVVTVTETSGLSFDNENHVSHSNNNNDNPSTLPTTVEILNEAQTESRPEPADNDQTKNLLLDDLKRKLPKEPLPIPGYDNKHEEMQNLSTVPSVKSTEKEETIGTSYDPIDESSTKIMTITYTATNTASTYIPSNNVEDLTNLSRQPILNSISTDIPLTSTTFMSKIESDNKTSETKVRESHSDIRHHPELIDVTTIVTNDKASESIEVSAAERAKEKEFPTEKDYENVDEATAELMRSIAGMIQARRDAKNILKRVKAAGLPQTPEIKAESEEFAENMLRELEEKEGTDKTSAKPSQPSSDLLRQSMEALVEVSRIGAPGVRDEGEEYDDGKNSLTTQSQMKNDEAEPMTRIQPENITSSTKNFETSIGANNEDETSSTLPSLSFSSPSSLSDEGIEKVISIPPGRNRHSKNFGNSFSRNKNREAENHDSESHIVMGESTDDETKSLTSVAMTTVSKAQNIAPKITVSNDEGAENSVQEHLVPMNENNSERSKDESETALKQQKKEKALELAPFDAFPSPPPSTNHTRAPPRSLAQWKVKPTQPNAQQQNSKALRTLVDNENEKSRDNENNIINDDLRYATKSISTRFPPTTRLPHHKRKLLATQRSSIEEEEFEATTIPTHTISIRTKAPTKRPAEKHHKTSSNSHGVSNSNDGVGPNGPYVDEETDESPFDFSLKHLPNYHHRRRQEEALAAAATSLVASRESEDPLEAEIATYERELQRKRERSKEPQNLGEGVDESISASSRGRSRFEKAEPRFDKHGPFDLSAEIRRSPAHRESDAASLYEIRQQLLERRLMQHNQQKKAKPTKSIVPPTFEEDRMVRESQEFIEADSIIKPNNNYQYQQNQRQLTEEEAGKRQEKSHSTIDDKSGRFEKPSKERTRESSQPRDGARQFLPRNNKPVEMPDIIVYDTVDYKNLPWIVKEGEKKHRSHENIIVNDLVPMDANEKIPMEDIDREKTTEIPHRELYETSTAVFVAEPPYQNENQENVEPKITEINVLTTTNNEESSTESYTEYSESTEMITSTASTITTTMPTTAITVADDSYWTRRTTLENTASSLPYNPAKFYYVPHRKRKLPLFKEKVLTFCSKETAIRDANNLIIACGGDDGVWQPNRCPPSTACFVAPDSTYHICCPVAAH